MNYAGLAKKVGMLSTFPDSKKYRFKFSLSLHRTNKITGFTRTFSPSTENNIFNQISPGSWFFERLKTFVHHRKSNIKLAIVLCQSLHITAITIIRVIFDVFQ